VRILFVVLAVLLIVPGWAGEEPVRVYPPAMTVTTARVTLAPGDPTRKRVGALRFLGGWSLASRASGFGGFSALAIDGDRFVLLGDNGQLLRFRLGRDWRISALEAGALPGGPGPGWDKRDRDSESLAVDAANDRAWVGFENDNAIWRYSADLRRVERSTRPAAMRRWYSNGGAETLAPLADGRFVVISEEMPVPAQRWRGSSAVRKRTRDLLIFPQDPTAGAAPARSAYVVQGRFDVVDATQSADGDLLVLERAFYLPYRFATRLMRIKARDLAPGRVIHPEHLATLDRPLIHDNFEGIATTREGGATIVWLVSDDNQSRLQRTLLLKFRLDG
jgi:hypothetical protein